MQLSKFADYGLRVLMYLSVAGNTRVTAGAIARDFNASEHHIAKVVSALAKGDFIISARGRTGGLSLRHPAPNISIGAVTRFLTSETSVVECFAANNTCGIVPTCGLRSPLAEAKEAFYTVLDGYTLAQVTQDKNGLRDLLQLKN